MQLKIDCIEGAGSYESRELNRYRRIAYVSGITGEGHSRTVNVYNAPGMPAIGDKHPDKPRATLKSRQADSVLANDVMRVELIYETPRGAGGEQGAQSRRWIVQDATSLTTESTQLLPGLNAKAGKGGVPLRVAVSVSDKRERMEDTGTISFQRPIRALTLSGPVLAGTDEDIKAAVGCVNADNWQGKPRGYWLFAGFSSTSSTDSLLKQLELTFLTRNREDWGTGLILRDSVTGRFIQGDDVDEAAKKLRQKEYGYGILYPDNANNKGIIKVCPYIDVPFFSIFGI